MISTNSTPWSTIVTTFVNAVQAALGKTIQVVVTTRPEDQLGIYEAQDAVLVRVGPPRPFPRCGAGRWGRRVLRDISAVILTQSYVDPAGADTLALTVHAKREEAVENAVEYILPMCILCEWVDGGEEIVRQVKTDPGTLVSALCFRVEYTSPQTVS